MSYSKDFCVVVLGSALAACAPKFIFDQPVPGDGNTSDAAIEFGDSAPRDVVTPLDVSDASSADASADVRLDTFGSDATVDTMADATADTGIADVSPQSIPAPRQISPLSQSYVTSQTPTLAWALSTGAADGATVQVCSDAVLMSSCQMLSVQGTQTRPSTLTPGVWFWRVRGRLGAVDGANWSPIWEFSVGVRSTPIDTSWLGMLDVNRDGYADVAVGDVSNSDNTARIYLGGTQGINTGSYTSLNAPTGSTDFGIVIASAGDINGDGFGDIIVGSRSLGNAYVFTGGQSGISQSYSGVIGGFYSSLAGAGDVNGDGFADVLVGNANANNMNGTVSLYLGSANGLVTPAATTLTGSVYAQLGWSVSTAGDINGDRFADVVVGDPGGGNPANSPGEARVYLGSANGLMTPPSATLNGSDDSKFGSAVACAEDLNGDGYSDLVIGAPTANNYDGAFYVYLGSSTGVSSAPITVNGPTGARNRTGSSVASAGITTDVGYADVLVGSPDDTSNTGSVALYHGASGGITQPAASTFTGLATGDNFGIALGGVGQVSDNGYADFVVLNEPTGNTPTAYFFRATSFSIAPTTSATAIHPASSTAGAP